MLDELIFIQMRDSLIILFFFCCIYFLIYKKHICSFFDPLTFFVFNLSTASVLIIKEGITSDVANILQFFLFQIFFWFGFSRIKVNFDKPAKIDFSKVDIALMEYVTFTLFLIYLVANLYFFAIMGAPIFTDDPTLAKIESYRGGLGFVRRINWGVANFISCSAIVLSLVGEYKKLFLSILLIQIIFSATSGSKGGTLLSFIFLITLIANRNDFRIMPQISIYKKLIKYLFASALLIGTTVLFITTGDITLSLFGMYHRAMMAGDAVIYYYRPDIFESFSSYGLWDFIYHEVNPILGFFKLAEYESPLGKVLVERYLASISAQELASDFGPNAPFYVEGHIYFGTIAGLGYSFILGYAVSYVRRQYFNATNIGIVPFIFLLNLTSLVLTAPQDTTFFITQCMDSMLLTILVYLFYSMTFSTFIRNKTKMLTKQLN